MDDIRFFLLSLSRAERPDTSAGARSVPRRPARKFAKFVNLGTREAQFFRRVRTLCMRLRKSASPFVRRISRYSRAALSGAHLAYALL
jgi:hypothetical protein